MTKMVEERALIGIKNTFPDLDWKRFHDMHRSLNWELLFGPYGAEYWSEIDPLENYEWVSFAKTQNDLLEFMSELPWQIYMDIDSDSISVSDPYDDIENWVIDEEDEDNSYFIGGEYTLIEVADILLSRDVKGQIGL